MIYLVKWLCLWVLWNSSVKFQYNDIIIQTVNQPSMYVYEFKNIYIFQNNSAARDFMYIKVIRFKICIHINT